jgi:sodium/potassium-transporting ATPase subunit alpha
MGPMDARCLIFSGTSVAAGEGLAIVTRIGSDTAIGQIAQMAGSSAPTESQLTHEMDAAVRLLVLCGLTTSITLLTIVFAQGFGLANAVQVTIGSLLSFLPQGLPATVTVSLTVAAKRLAKQNVLVKNLRGIETLGTITLLATDKTGTLTMNKMTVVALWSGEEIVSLAEEAEKEAFVGGAKEQYNELLEACALCTNIRVLEGGDLLGDATEQGIYQFVTEQLQYKPPLSFTRTHEIPFTSKTKRHLIAGSVNGEGSRTRIYMKGAPERVLERCRGNDEQFRVRVDEIYTRMAGMGWRVLAFGSRDVEGSVEQHALEEIQDLTFQGLLALQDPPKPGVADTMRKLRRAGIQLIMVTGDHPLTASAIARQIGLITKPLAGSIGEVSAGTAFAVHGDALRSLTAADWERLFSTDELIFARTQPQQKLQIVSSFQGHGHIVGASGDGVNDAPALKVADLGISMNETAADVSKNAADIILLDDDFSTIAIGVFEGRLVFENLKKSLRYTLTHIVPELSSLAVTAIAGIPLPLSAILILVFDVFCEPGPAMSYAFEAAPVNLLKLKPRLRRRAKSGHQHGWAAYFGLGSKGGERLIDKDMVLWCFFQGGIIIACGCFGAYIVSMALSKVPLSSLFHAANKYFEGRIGVTVSSLVLTDGNVAGVAVQEEILAKAQSSYFLSLIIGQHFNLFLTKHRYRYPHGWDIFYNRYTYLGMLISGGIGALIVFVPPFQAAFGTSSVYAASIACAFVTGGMLVFYEYVRRYLRFTGIVGKPPEGRILMKSQ